jgi:hypothetical protein
LSGCIVSLTTYHKRFPYAHLAIESLLSQKCPYEYDVHLYLARTDIIKNGGSLPASIEALTEKGLKIFIEDEDLLSYKKIVYALRENPEKTIITVDDDIVYPDGFLFDLIQASQKFPGCVVCFRGHFLSFDRRGRLRPYDEIMDRKIDDAKRLIPSFCLIPTGVSGILYPPHSLDEMAADPKQFMRLCPRADDIWMKIASLKKGTLCVQVTNSNPHFPAIPGTQEESLSHMNIRTGRNDQQLQACFARFPDLLEKVREDALRLETLCKVPLSVRIRDRIQIIRRKLRLRRIFRFIRNRFSPIKWPESPETDIPESGGPHAHRHSSD